jgi:predicted nucleic acid-binding protein
MIVVDTGAWYAVFDSAEPTHEACTTFLATSTEGLVTTPLVLAELDHLLTTRLGEQVRNRVMLRLASGAVTISAFDVTAFARSAQIASEHTGMRLGLTDASVMVAAAQNRTTRLFTLDHEHFRALRPLDHAASAYTLLPADAGDGPQQS